MQSFILFQDPKKYFLCVGNIDSTTSAETFSLYLEYIAGGDAEIDSVVYTEDRSTAVVEFNTPVGMFIADFILPLKQNNIKYWILHWKSTDICQRKMTMSDNNCNLTVFHGTFIFHRFHCTISYYWQPLHGSVSFLNSLARMAVYDCVQITVFKLNIIKSKKRKKINGTCI